MKNLILITLLAFSVSVNAATINQGTSDRLSAEFIDLGVTHLDLSTGLEWLDFGTLIDGERQSVTFSHSVDSAIAAYSPQGFRMATEADVTGLFNLFFPTFVDSGDGTMSIDDTVEPPSVISEERNSWLFAFGSSVSTGGDLSSLGFYLDSFGNVQEAGIDLTTNPLSSTIYGLDYREWVTGTDEAYGNRGVFMVRDYTVVPVPAAVWLFGSGLLGLVAVARRKV